ncbi:MAG: hypothetical protein NTZ16_14355 [Verrucomicrobia bacterium]|nr:hypothetical protein [Verrucomicrobiota bacterium]
MGEPGATAAAVPPPLVVWKSQPATNGGFTASVLATSVAGK